METIINLQMSLFITYFCRFEAELLNLNQQRLSKKNYKLFLCIRVTIPFIVKSVQYGSGNEVKKTRHDIDIQ